MNEAGEVKVAVLGSREREWARRLIIERWGSDKIVTHGVIYDVERAPGFVAFVGDTPQGLLTYDIKGVDCKILTLDSIVERCGIGRALLAALLQFLSSNGFQRAWLITRNDNTDALKFYQKRGFRLRALYPDAVKESRKLKPEIPEVGIDGIAIRDELELPMRLH